MTWSSPAVRSTGELITAAIWNADIVGNMLALKEPNSAHYELDEGSDYTTTSTSFANVDATLGKLSLAITLAEQADVFVHFHGTVNNSGGNVFLDLSQDGTRLGLNDGILKVPTGSITPVSITQLIPDAAAGAHTYNLMWKVSAGTGTMYAGAGTSTLDLHPQFWVREIS